jgi:hypothetical protein
MCWEEIAPPVAAAYREDFTWMFPLDMLFEKLPPPTTAPPLAPLFRARPAEGLTMSAPRLPEGLPGLKTELPNAAVCMESTWFEEEGPSPTG